MKPDDFEKQLQRQPLRTAPSCRREHFMHMRNALAQSGDGVVRMQLWGFSVICDLTVTVQEGSRLLQKKS